MAAIVVCGLVAAIASPLLELGKLVCGPIYRTTTSVFKLQSNLNDLEKKLQELSDLAEEVKQELEEAKKNGGRATRQAKAWRRKVDGIMAVAEEILLVSGRRIQPASTAGTSLTPNNTTRFSGCFSKCFLSRKVSKTLMEVQKLLAANTNLTIVATSGRAPTVERIPVISIEHQTTASQNLAKMMELLNRDEVRRIGVWGMGGVGKTTLVKNLNNKLQSISSDQPFGKVIWITVSKEMNSKLVQTRIAERLEFDLRDCDEVSMAARLHDRLLREEKFLLILDDVWDRIDLDRLGIPQPDVHKGYKIVLTTRSQAVCSQMSMDEQFTVAILSEEEAWQLFCTSAGEVANIEQIVPYAKAVARECNGLPLAIIVVGAAMRRKESMELWKDALNELKRPAPSIPGIEKEVFNPLKWSYDSLQGESIKSFFLFCCLYPEDHKIDKRELVQSWMGEGLVDVGPNYEDLINRGIAMIENLKDSCLLKDLDKGDWHVTMHDIVRDVGIWIASSSEDGHKSLVRSGVGLTHFPEEVELSGSFKRISLMNNEITKLPSECMMQSSNALTLFLQGNKTLEEVPEGFLQGFPAVRVLNLSHTNISSLPPSVMQLADLTTLLLEGCYWLNELPTLGWEGLKRIRVLDLSYTCIREFPREMGMLISLRKLCLNIGDLEIIPAGVFSMLSSLEILDMEGSVYAWGLKRDVEDGKAHLEELQNLSRLRVISFQLKRKTTLSSIVNLTWISRLTTFRLLIGMKSTHSSFEGVMKEVYIKGINLPAEERLDYLLSSTNAASLQLHKCQGLDGMLQNLTTLEPTACFSALKSLTILGCDGNFNLTGERCSAHHDLLPNLEYLLLSDFERVDIESISQLVGHLGLRLSKLKRLNVWRCKGMKYLLSLGGKIQILENLVEVCLSDCPQLEKLFQHVNVPLRISATGQSQIIDSQLNVVPKLRRISLDGLPKLRTVCRETDRWSELEEIFVKQCDHLKKLPLSSQNKNTIKMVSGEPSWWKQLEWDDIAAKDCLDHLFRARYKFTK